MQQQDNQKHIDRVSFIKTFATSGLANAIYQARREGESESFRNSLCRPTVMGE